MLIQIAILAWVFLGERLTVQGIAGLALAAIGMLVVQVRRGAPAAQPAAADPRDAPAAD